MPIRILPMHPQEPLLILIVTSMGTEQAWWEHHLGPRESSLGSTFDPIYLCDLGKAILGSFY